MFVVVKRRSAAAYASSPPLNLHSPASSVALPASGCSSATARFHDGYTCEATIFSDCARNSSRRACGRSLTSDIRCANDATKGLPDGAVEMNCCICAIVARMMKRGGIMFFATRARASAIASSIRVLTWPSRAT